MEKLSMATKRQTINRQKRNYRKSSKKQKTTILDSLQTTTGLSRQHLIRVLSSDYDYESPYVKSGRGRKPIYSLKHKQELRFIWELLDYPCAKRLREALPAVMNNLEKHGHVKYDEDFKRQMQKISHGTIDRLLAKDREHLKPFGLSTTKPGTTLKNQIPIRRGTDWDNHVPGFVEIDLVAHCGSSTAGEYVNTLNCIDVLSGWTECRAVVNKARLHTLEALKHVREKLPFPLQGIDSDNGSEFINGHFFYYCKSEDLVFTRSRPNHSNDSCYVEQKNWSVVRKAIGYQRFQGENAVNTLNAFYDQLRLMVNYFLPSQKLLDRKRDGGKVIKKHDCATTPYRRLCLNPLVDEWDKKRLQQEFQSLDLLQIRKEMDQLLAKIKASGLGY